MNILKNLATHKYFFFILIYAAIFTWTSSSSGEVLYYDDFEDGVIDAKYEFKNHAGNSDLPPVFLSMIVHKVF